MCAGASRGERGPVMTVREQHAEALEQRSEARRDPWTGPRGASAVRARWPQARATARATVSSRFSRVSRPKLPTTNSPRPMPSRPRRAATAAGATGVAWPHGDVHDLGAGHLLLRPLGHEDVVDGHQPRRPPREDGRAGRHRARGRRWCSGAPRRAGRLRRDSCRRPPRGSRPGSPRLAAVVPGTPGPRRRPRPPATPGTCAPGSGAGRGRGARAARALPARARRGSRGRGRCPSGRSPGRTGAPVPRAEAARVVHPHSRGKRPGIDRLLRVEHVDLVLRREQAEDLGRCSRRSPWARGASARGKPGASPANAAPAARTRGGRRGARSGGPRFR